MIPAKERWYETRIFAVLFSGILASLITAYCLHIWHADFSVPFELRGNVDFYRMRIQNLIETGDWNSATRLGGTEGLKYQDGLSSGWLNWIFLVIFSLFTKNPSSIMNLYYLLGFPLAAMSATYVLRSFRASNLAAIFAGLLFPFLPFHFASGESDLFLSAYFLIPFAILMAFYIEEGMLRFSWERSDSVFENIRRNRRVLFFFLVGIGITGTSVSYFAFTCFFLLIAFLTERLRNRQWTRATTTSFALIGVTVLSYIISLLPSFVFQIRGGTLAGVANAAVSDGEKFSFKLIDLIIPYSDHHLGRFRNMVQLFHNSEPVSNQNTAVALGIFGVFGLLLLLLYPLLRFGSQKSTEHDQTWVFASKMLYCSIFLCAFGGFGTWIYRYATTGIRFYYQICVFIFFFALIAVALFVDLVLRAAKAEPQFASRFGKRIGKWWTKTTRIRVILLSLILVPLLFVAIYDLVPMHAFYSYSSVRETAKENQTFFTSVETSLGADTLVYVLPDIPLSIPEDGATTNANTPLTPYLYTQSLRFSAGSILGSKAQIWNQEIAAMAPNEVVTALREQNYGAVYFDLSGDKDGSLRAQMNAIVTAAGSTPIISKDGQQWVIDLRKTS